MLRKSILTVMFLFGLSASAHAQIPVTDVLNLAQNIFQVAKAIEQIIIENKQLIIQGKQLEDMILQGSGGAGPDNQLTAALLALQALYGQEGSVLYGRYSPALWTDTFKEDIVYRNGEWVEDETIRDHRRLTTQMDLMQLLKIRQDAFGRDTAHIANLKRAVDGCESRNCLIQTSAAVQAEAAWQSLQAQQLTMVIANAQAVAQGGEVNDVTQKRAQEKYFMRNGGAPVQPVVWDNPGIY